MKVAEHIQKELIAHKFNNDTKDDIFLLLGWYNCTRFPSFDNDKNPILKIGFGEEYTEKVVNFGDYIILDNTENKVIEVLTEEEFDNKYTIKTNATGYPIMEVIPL